MLQYSVGGWCFKVRTENMNIINLVGDEKWEHFQSMKSLENNSVLSDDDGLGDNRISGNFSLLVMHRNPSGVFKLAITPILDNFVFKIFFFIIATSVVFLVSIATAFIFMKLMYYLSDLVEVIFNIYHLINFLWITFCGLRHF